MEREDYKVTLEAARVNVGLTQIEASRAIGVSKNTLAKYEKGKTAPTIPTLKKICSVYRVPMDCISFMPVGSI